MSMVLHLSLFVAAALMIRPRVLPPREEHDRPVSIVLAERSGAEATRYFAASDQVAGDPHSPPAHAPSTSAAGAEDPGDPLPAAAAAESLLLDADLPKLAEGVAGAGVDGSAVQLPALTGSGRRQILPGLGDDEILANDPLRNRSAGPSGPTAKMTLFGRAGVGRSFVFLIDRSKSMGSQGLGAIAAAQRELVRELGHLKPDHRFQIIAYNQGLMMFNRRGMVEASERNRQRADEFLTTVVAAGGTEHEPPLSIALRIKPDVIFVLTDGGDPPLSGPEIELLSRENDGHTAIHCVHFGSGPLQEQDNFLRRLAARNGGGYAYIDMMRGR
jgi:hypothetical protein